MGVTVASSPWRRSFAEPENILTLAPPMRKMTDSNNVAVRVSDTAIINLLLSYSKYAVTTERMTTAAPMILQIKGM